MLPAKLPHRRVLAPVLHRPTSRLAQGLPPWARVEPLAVLCSYSDEPVKPGRLLVLEVFPDSGGPVTALVEVESCDPMPEGFAARFDVTMRLLRADGGGLSRLETVLASR
jgi:hypothetical protein